ncbi:MAG: 16S rRNA (cytosine(1402)-N(4))-methyltransferase RsmH [Patescibacteria group bacterium]
MTHIPVLLKEVLTALDPRPGKSIIDATIGGGGHGIPIAERLSPRGIFVGIDWDQGRIQELEYSINKERLKLDRFVLACSNYVDLPKVLEKEGLEKVDGVLIDLGFSSDQLLDGKGFSFRGKEEPLIMTYNDNDPPAYQVLSTLAEKEITEVIKDLSDERYARWIAKAIVARRKVKSIATNKDLAEVVQSAVPKNYEKGRIHPATRTFMALRIYVNHELENLGRTLGSIKEIVKPGGRVAIITYHSKEDAMVKHFFKDLVEKDEGTFINKKPIIPTEEEIKENPRSRSAKLRTIEIK